MTVGDPITETERRRIAEAVEKVTKLLVAGEYDALEAISDGVRLTAAQIKEAIAEYGRRLILPSVEAFENADIVRVTNADRTWSVRFDLWTEEEGRSDLSIEMTVVDRGEPDLAIEIDNIHVL